MARYGLAVILQKAPKGYLFGLDELPLHLTLIDSFEIELEAEEFGRKLHAFLMGLKTFEVTAIADVMFGPNKDIPVTTVELTEELKVLHDRLVEFIHTEHGKLRYPEFNGENYRPHVSIYGPRRVEIGDSITVRDISLSGTVETKLRTDRKIFEIIRLRHT